MDVVVGTLGTVVVGCEGSDVAGGKEAEVDEVVQVDTIVNHTATSSCGRSISLSKSSSSLVISCNSQVVRKESPVVEDADQETISGTTSRVK